MGFADLPLFLTPADVARLLRTSRKAIYALHARGHIEGGMRVGRRLLFARDQLIGSLHESREPSLEKPMR